MDRNGKLGLGSLTLLNIAGGATDADLVENADPASWRRMFEVNVLGAVAGLDLRRPALKLPGWGRIGIDPAGATETLIAPTASS